MKSNNLIFYLVAVFFSSCSTDKVKLPERDLCEEIKNIEFFKHYYSFEGTDSLFLKAWNLKNYDSLFKSNKEYKKILYSKTSFQRFKDTFQVAVDSFYTLEDGTLMARLFIYSNILPNEFFFKTRSVIVYMVEPYMGILSMRHWGYELHDSRKVIEKNGVTGVYFGIDLGPIKESKLYKNFKTKNKCPNITFENIVKAHNFYVKGYVTDQFD